MVSVVACIKNSPVTFYAAGLPNRLHDLCIFLKKESPSIHLSKDERRDLFYGSTVVLVARLNSPSALPGICQTGG